MSVTRSDIISADMGLRISSPTSGVRAALIPAIVVFVLIGCGKSGSEEKVATSAPAPAPASPLVANPRATFAAEPNPVIVNDGTKLGVMKLTWSTTATKSTEIHVGKPDGTLFCEGYATGSCETGKWVSDGLVFYLQDSGAAKSTDPSATLAVVIAKVQ